MKLVRLWENPCKNNRKFKYVLIWNDEPGKLNFVESPSQGRARELLSGRICRFSCWMKVLAITARLWSGLILPDSLWLVIICED